MKNKTAERREVIKILEKRIPFFVSFIVESDAIENITANPKLIEQELKARKRAGHVGAMLFLEKIAQRQNKFISKDLICRIQSLITAEQHTKLGGPKLKPECIGKFRQISVSIGGNLAPDPALLPLLMNLWVFSVREWQKNFSQSPVRVNLQRIATFHYEYEKIHPFVDGNGRSGRALVYYLMQYCGMRPFVFTGSDKYETYYRCFSHPEDMDKYFYEKTIS